MRKKLKVLFITVRADHGGGPKHLEQLLQYLKVKIQCVVACPREDPYWDRFANEVGEENLVELPHRQFSMAHFLWLVRFCKKHRVDIVHSHGKGAGLYGRLLRLFCKVQTVHTYHGIHIGKYGKLKKKVYLLLERFLSRFTARAICVSPSELETVLRLKIVSSHRVCVIKNGVLVHDLAPRQVPAFLNVVTITRFELQKNTELILEIMEGLKVEGRLDAFHFQFIGDGPNREALCEEVKLRGFEQNCQFLGLLSSTDICLKDAFCYLSTSRWEGLPIAILEAMAWANPIVATKVEGNTDLVQEGSNGFLYPLSHPRQASQALIRLSENPLLWEKMSTNSYRTCKENYDIRKSCDEVLNVYFEVTGLAKSNYPCSGTIHEST